MPSSGANHARDEKQVSSSDARLPSILIVDDSHDSANSLHSLFGAHGYEAHVACDGDTAFEIAKAHLPDIILLDLGMPGMDGIHLARFVREDEQLKDKVLIAITGYADDRHRQQCDAVGFDYTLSKPVAWNGLQSTIIESISFKASMQTLEAFQPLIELRTASDAAKRLRVYQDLLDAIASHRVADRPGPLRTAREKAEIKRKMAKGVIEI